MNVCHQIEMILGLAWVEMLLPVRRFPIVPPIVSLSSLPELDHWAIFGRRMEIAWLAIDNIPQETKVRRYKSISSCYHINDLAHQAPRV